MPKRLLAIAALVAWSLVMAEPAVAADASAARRAARELGLAGSARWLKLGRWQPDGPGRRVSEVDGPLFFLSPRGKVDPAAELAATIHAFWQQPVTAVADDHPLCRFPMRRLWLLEALPPAVARTMPQPHCPRLADHLERSAAVGVSLVFSSYYLNNPSSAFGHTFLRLHRPGPPLGERQELLDRAVDFSADTAGEGPVRYAVWGLAGRFRGTFKMMPYYYKVREYNDFESRDLWSYELDLDEAALLRLRLHLWELGDTWFDYWYFTENCSYHILGLLEVAVPGVELRSRLSRPVLPSETIRVVAESPGLVRRITWRPSLHTRFRASVDGVPAQLRTLVDAAARDAGVAFPAGVTAWAEARVLDAAADLLDLREAESIILDPDSPPARRRRELLARRAELGPLPPAPSPTAAADAAPHRGHRSWRIGLGSGWSGDRPAATLTIRPALHHLADPGEGYPPLSSVDILPTAFEVTAVAPYIRLAELDLIRILSLHDADAFDMAPSWAVRFGRTTLREQGCTPCGVFRATLAGGFAQSFWEHRLSLWAFGEGTMLAGEALRAFADTPALRAGGGPAAGMRLRLTPRATLMATGAWHWFPWQTPATMPSAEALLRWVPLADWGIEGEAVLQGIGPSGWLRILRYF